MLVQSGARSYRENMPVYDGLGKRVNSSILTDKAEIKVMIRGGEKKKTGRTESVNLLFIEFALYTDEYLGSFSQEWEGDGRDGLD